MQISRDWATPLTIGSFVLMAVTGLLMFFHLDIGLNKLAHEWIGWIMVAGAALHGAVNWHALKRHLLLNRTGQVIVVVSVLMLVISFFMPAQKRGPNPMFLTVQVVMSAPVSDVAALLGKSPEFVIEKLSKAGFGGARAESKLRDLTLGNRQREGMLLETLFSQSEAE